ncbi:20548_t:CDS:2 [Cetraspora pellucida]|uniref:20548_t:CDS:1 n=1 Tax=Cetraspora pellucida TaxID=1433469 RepID=A0A9N9DS28_9GLOM|nr:20548_t:CDS:2 [Cetraspora pellucida]
MPYDRIGNKTYKFALNCIDIATCTKWTYPLTKHDSASMAKGGIEFQGNVIILMNEYGIQIQLANSKESIDIVERFNYTLQEWAFFIQDELNNSVTRLLGPFGFDEPRLSHDVLVRYLLKPGELKVQKNQPVLYWLIDGKGNGSKRSFVREKLQIIPSDTELPPQ